MFRQGAAIVGALVGTEAFGNIEVGGDDNHRHRGNVPSAR
jgi:hypothetical protein